MNLSQIKPNIQKAVFLAKRQLVELVTDAVNLEGICFTIPEVQTLLDGITVGGHKISDQVITLNQAEAWRFLFDIVLNNQFALSEQIACQIHQIAAKNDALEWGKFRSGSVTIAGTQYLPPKAEHLNRLWVEMVEKAESFTNIYEKAIFIFLEMSRNQFFYDVNKRMGRFMMNGFLLSHGYPVINVPAKRQQEFNSLMIKFYQSHDHKAMNVFMLSCIDPRIVDIMSE
jgi:Fic family protein